MANIFDVAKYILETEDSISTMKLQKLCYYSQAWSLVWDDQPLFHEDFEAWANGPVCHSLFSIHKGKFSIEASDIPDDLLTGTLSQGQIQSISKVLEYYGNKDAQWLSTLSHMEDPWKIARVGYAPGMPCDVVMTKESIAEYYGSL